MIDDDSRGIANRFTKPISGRLNQPNGPILPSNSPQGLFPPSKLYNGKPAIQTLRGIDVPDKLGFTDKSGGKHIGERVFDAELNRDAKTITLIVRLKFEFVDQHKTYTDKDKPYFGEVVKSWKDQQERQNKFIRDFLKVVSERWSYKHRVYPAGPTTEPVPWFITVVRAESVSNTEHKVVKVHFDHDREISQGSFMEIVSRASMYDHNIIVSESDVNIIPVTNVLINGRKEKTYNYCIAAHEFGHAIGIEHINQKDAEKNPNINPYGETLVQQRDTMGVGSQVSVEDYWPFLVAMYYFTGSRWEAK
ncbi:MAG: matrixin family metalloprotease [Saprospiraceae bacterium]